MTEVDKILQQGVDTSIAFTILNEDNTPYDLTGYTVVMRVYKEIPVDLPGVISGAGDNIVTVISDNTVNTETGFFEYRVLGTLGPIVEAELGRGNIYYLPVQGFTTQIPTIIINESLGLVIPVNYQTQQILYWKYFLAPAFNILPENTEDEAFWPILGKFLIAKLVVYDYLVQQLKLSISNGFTSSGSSSSVGSGGLKSLQEGPSKAEFYDVSKTITDLLKTGAGGTSSFDQLKADICNLAHRVRIYLPMCGLLSVDPVVPEKAECGRCLPTKCTPFLLNVDNVNFFS